MCDKCIINYLRVLFMSKSKINLFQFDLNINQKKKIRRVLKTKKVNVNDKNNLTENIESNQNGFLQILSSTKFY